MCATAYGNTMAESYRVVHGEDSHEDQQQMRTQAAIKQQQLLLTKSLQEFCDLWAIEAWQHGEFLAQAEEAEFRGEALQAKNLRKKGERCLNSMIRLINFPASPVALLLNVSGLATCEFLTKERAEDLVAFAYNGKDRNQTFNRLGEWVRLNGHHHVQVQDHVAESKHMTACDVCMTKSKQLLVNRYRADTHNVTADYFKGLIMSLNGTASHKA